MCELAFANGKDEITNKDVDAVFEQHETSQLFTAPLYEVADPVARLVALRLLEVERRPITEATVSEIASREGIALDLGACRRLCDYLVIERVLTWQAGAYTIAGDALIHYARRQSGALERLLHDTRRLAKERDHASGWAN